MRLLKQTFISNLSTNIGRLGKIFVCSIHSPIQYGRINDPTNHFFDTTVQQFLLELTRIDQQKIFCKKSIGKHQDSNYEFLTDAQLKEKLDVIKLKTLELLQFPPALPVRENNVKVFSVDKGLKGFDNAKIVFTDITFGLEDRDRSIVIREQDGSLKEADWQTKERMNQVYFPEQYRQLKLPQLFSDNLMNVLNQKEYIFVLDLACQQFEPDDPEYQKVVSITYKHINENNEFEKLRSTRHFGSLTFFLIWNHMVDNLLLDLIETCYLEEAQTLVKLYFKIHGVKTNHLKNTLIEDFIDKYAIKKGVLELALQSTRDFLKQKEIIEDGIKRTHGSSL